jgi:hypothetical protein
MIVSKKKLKKLFEFHFNYMGKVIVQSQMALTNGQHESQNIQKFKHSKFVVYVEGTLYPWISLVEIGRDIMPTHQR